MPAEEGGRETSCTARGREPPPSPTATTRPGHPPPRPRSRAPLPETAKEPAEVLGQLAHTHRRGSFPEVHHDVRSGPTVSLQGRSRLRSKDLAEPPAGPVPLCRTPDPLCDGQPEANVPSLVRADEQHQVPAGQLPSLVVGLPEIRSPGETMTPREDLAVHSRNWLRLRPKGPCAPWRVSSRGLPVRSSCASGPGIRGFSCDAGCSAGRFVSS